MAVVVVGVYQFDVAATVTKPQCPFLYSRAVLKPAGVVLILGSQ